MSWTGANLTVDSYVGLGDTLVSAEMIKNDLTSNGFEIISREENETRHMIILLHIHLFSD